MRRIILCLALGGALPAPASAHALLRDADPAVGATVAAAPPELSLRFSEAVEPAFSEATVTDAAGRAVNTGPPHLAPDDAKRLLVPLPRLAPGSYGVSWRAVSVDTHRTEGRFRFTVAP